MSVKYSNLGGSLDDAALVKKLFDTVPERFLNVVAWIEQFFDLKTLAFDEAVGRLNAFEERTWQGAGGVRFKGGQVLLTQGEWEAKQKNSGGDSSGKGRKQESGGRGRGRGRGGGSSSRGGHGDAGKDSMGKRDKSHIKCFKCHKYMHYANRCPVEKKGEEAHCVKAEDKEPTVLFAETATPGLLEHPPRSNIQRMFLNEARIVPELHLTGGGDPTGDVWYLDNGASNHKTIDRSKFRDLDHAISGKVRFGDDSTIEIQD
ncbi:uncharacterized protein [Miscanthus floridulus]|uniref:uncharacterized protein n=1 Tax=Miscanthus floridulus TaxID=154761 RepID=UPI0034580B4A